jgi:hypothetical protein
MQRREAKISPGDPERYARKIPAEAAYFESAWKSAGWWDWMVVRAVLCEPVSNAAFPANRVITGNFSEFGLREVLVGEENGLAATVSVPLPAQNLTAKIF